MQMIQTDPASDLVAISRGNCVYDKHMCNNNGMNEGESKQHNREHCSIDWVYRRTRYRRHETVAQMGLLCLVVGSQALSLAASRGLAALNIKLTCEENSRTRNDSPGGLLHVRENALDGI